METLPEQQSVAPAIKTFKFWLLRGCIVLLLLLLTLLLFAGHFLSSATFKQKIQQAVVTQTGIEIDWQAIGLNYFPSPAITLKQLTFAAPGRMQGKVDEFSLFPEMLPLLTGNLRLARLVLQGPEIGLELPVSKAGRPSVHSDPRRELELKLAKALGVIAPLAPNLDLIVHDGRLLVACGEHTRITSDKVEMHLVFSVVDSGSARATLQGGAVVLGFQGMGQQETIKGVEMNGSVDMSGDTLKLELEHLSLADPSLELSGTLNLNQEVSGINLNLSGRNIDVDATRRVALALAGDLPPVSNIFSYLRGGKVPMITIQTRGETAADLGELKNLRIEGELRQGVVSIPAIKLDLTEVAADVLLADGVLVGTGLSTRLEGSSGHDGRFRVGLAKGNDLFQLELLLNADLAQAKQILDRIVDNPAFSQELDLITHLHGRGVGKLTLGDSFTNISAKVDVTALDFSAEYKRLPFPIKVTSGQAVFSKKLISLAGWNGSVGHSNFSGLACQVDLRDVLNLDVRTGPVAISLDEFYPWLISVEGLSKPLKEFRQVSGFLDLSSLRFRGGLDKPDQLQVAATGAIRDLRLSTSLLPGEVRLVKGDFTFVKDELTITNLSATSLDATLVLNGNLKGLPRNLNRLDMTLDGTLGKAAVAWLGKIFGVSSADFLRTPLALKTFMVTWQQDSPTTCNGALSFKDGPELTVDIAFEPNYLHAHRVTVRDQDSEADMALNFGPDKISLDFSGSLQDETLAAMFAGWQFGKGRLEGDFSIKVPRENRTESSAKGKLKGSDLLIPLPAGDKVRIKQIELDADGARINVDLSALSWKDYTWAPVKGLVDFTQGEVHVLLTEAMLCGIGSSGDLTVAGKELSIDVSLDGKGLNVANSYACLTKGKVRMTGFLDISSRVRTQGTLMELFGKMQGPLAMTFTNGVIQQEKMLSRILELLNITGIVRGRLPNLDSNGFAYKTITLQGDFHRGKLRIEKLSMDGETLDVLGHGEIDMQQSTVNLELLAAPFKTADMVIKNIPGVSYLLAGSLVAIPVSIKGNLDDPQVRILSASSVGTSLLEFGERIFNSPLRLIESFEPARPTQNQ